MGSKSDTLGKDEAIALLGGTKAEAARAMGISRQSVNDWPDPLPRRIALSVFGVLYLKRRRPKARTGKPAHPQQAAGLEVGNA